MAESARRYSKRECSGEDKLLKKKPSSSSTEFTSDSPKEFSKHLEVRRAHLNYEFTSLFKFTLYKQLELLQKTEAKISCSIDSEMELVTM